MSERKCSTNDYYVISRGIKPRYICKYLVQKLLLSLINFQCWRSG